MFHFLTNLLVGLNWSSAPILLVYAFSESDNKSNIEEIYLIPATTIQLKLLTRRCTAQYWLCHDLPKFSTLMPFIIVVSSVLRLGYLENAAVSTSKLQ